MTEYPVEAIIRPVAHALSLRFPLVDRDDIAQELRVWWIEHPARIEKWENLSLEGSADDADWRLKRDLSRVGERYCRQVTAQVQGFDPSDEVFYERERVRELLPMVYNPELMLVSNASQNEQKVSKTKAPNEGFSLPASVADVSRAVDTLSRVEQQFLLLHYGLNWTIRQVAENLNMTIASVKMREQRAIKNIVKFLGGESPWSGEGPGSRKTMSNAAAQAITSHQWS